MVYALCCCALCWCRRGAAAEENPADRFRVRNWRSSQFWALGRSIAARAARSRLCRGKNFVIEFRGAEGKSDRIPSLVTELVQLKVDVLVATSAGAIRAAKQASKTIPIVMVTAQDPVATGLIDSLARPGGNISGLTHTHARLKRKAAGIAQGSGSEYIASRSSHSGGCRPGQCV